MLISYNWLQNYLPDLHRFSKKEIGDSLTSSLAEVDYIIEVRHLLKDIIAGEITEIEKISKKLSLCKIKISENQIKNIVCGAPNVYEGQKVAVCLPGGVVHNPKDPKTPFEITEKKVNGVVSQGMICSPLELGITEEHDVILELEPEMRIGENIAELLKDTVFEIENKSLSHRSDCFSHEGISRELSAILKIDFLPQEPEEILFSEKSNLNLKINVRVNDELCPRFTAILLKDVTVKDSPIWIKSRLSAIGIRPINNVVDLTNYIMMDVGTPLHAYDYDKIQGGKLIIRKAKENEKVKTLDGKTHKLSNDMLVVADSKSIEDIAGVMGGYRTQITRKTKNIVLESANWNMYNIRKNARTLGIRTEASTRFEKGLDPSSTDKSLKSAVKLLFDITEGEIASEIIDVYPKPEDPKELTLDTSLVLRFLGIELNKQEIIEILKGLQFEILKEEKIDEVKPNKLLSQEINILVPSFRRDINIQHDILEEIARIHGYDNITPKLPPRDLAPVKPGKDMLLHRSLSNFLTMTGMDEIKTYSFTGKDVYTKTLLNIKECVEIINPQTSEQTHMRNSLLPNMLEKIEENARSIDEFRFFEIGRVISKTISENELHFQPWNICGITYDKNTDNMYSTIKGHVEGLLQYLNINAEFTEANKSSISTYKTYHPERIAVIKANGSVLGIVGEISPSSLIKWEIKGRVGAFELDLDILLEHYSPKRKYLPVSHYQAVNRDLSFWFAPETKYSDIINTIKKVESKLIRSINLKDLYFDAKSNRKSISIAILLQSYEKTLTEKEIQTVIDEIVDTIKTNQKGEFRSKK